MSKQERLDITEALDRAEDTRRANGLRIAAIGTIEIVLGVIAFGLCCAVYFMRTGAAQ